MTLADAINKMITRILESAKITSASPGHINTVKEIQSVEIPDLEQLIKTETNVKEQQQKKRTADAIDTVEDYKRGNVDKIQKLSSDSMSALKSFLSNPFNFFLNTIFKKLLKGPGLILFLIELAREIIKIIIDQLFAPGRIFDQRFRQMIDKQIIRFLARKEQQELKQGFKQIITTTTGSMRGSILRGQIGGNFYNPDRISQNFLDPRLVMPNNPVSQNAQRRSSYGGYAAARNAAYRRH